VTSKNKIWLDGIRVYSDTLAEVREYVASNPKMTIIRFYDEAAQEKLKQIKNVESTAQPIRGENDRKAD
jgi:hypothetical protein